jgi:hypothetical protein
MYQPDSTLLPARTQVPQGGLKKITNQLQNHIPRGDLKKTLQIVLPGEEHGFADIPVESIHHFTSIADYKKPTRSKYPIVVITKDSGDCHCIDGWELVRKASKNETIKCHIFLMDSYSVSGIAIFKAAVRSIPRGGICSHAEMMRNTRDCFRLIRGSDELPNKEFHGGCRKGPAFDNSTHQEIVALLADEFGKPKRKIREYINHADYMSDEALGYFVEKGAGRRFFEKAQKNKNYVTDNYKQEELNEPGIIKRVFDHMKEWFEEYTNSEKIATVCDKSKVSETIIEDLKETAKSLSKNKPQVHKHWLGNDTPDSSPTKNQIYDAFKTINESLVQLIEKRPDISEDLLNYSLNSAMQIMTVSQAIRYLLQQKTATPGKEVT